MEKIKKTQSWYCNTELASNNLASNNRHTILMSLKSAHGFFPFKMTHKIWKHAHTKISENGYTSNIKF